MKTASYLSKSRHGIYYFRWPLPMQSASIRGSIRLSLGTRCPKQAGELARFLASCGKVISENRALARLRQDEIREKVTAFFKAQLDQYTDRLNRYGLSKNALADAREEMLDHDCMVDLESINLRCT